MVLVNQADIFCIFHDGSFSSFIRNQGDVELTIDIQYLAELINPKYSMFKVKLRNCTKLGYHVWGEEHRIVADLNTLDKLDLEIANAEVMNNYVAVKCYSAVESCGGDLVFMTDDILIFDEGGQEISLDKLDEICKLYWSSDHKK